MSGIYGILNKKGSSTDVPHFRYFFSSLYPNILNEEFTYKSFTYGRSVHRKLLNDRVMHEDKELIIAFEGIIYNKTCNNNAEHLKTQYKKHGINFVETIDGLFSGFIYDKIANVIYVFSDHLNTRPVYYYSDKDCFMFSSELKHISGYLRGNQKSLTPDYDGIYSMLGFGFLMDDLTYIKEVRNLLYGSFLKFDVRLFNFTINNYFAFEKKIDKKLTRAEIIDKINNLMINNVKKHWNKDKEYNYRHYSALSGGMDAKTQLLLAAELGFSDITTITFGESGSSDHNISLDVAKRNNFEHIYLTLDNGTYLTKNIDEYIKATDGLMPFFSFSHGYNSMKKINHNNYGILHSGQIGDVVFGSFINPKFNIDINIYNMSYHGIMPPQIYKTINCLPEIMNRYRNNNYELFSYEQRQINGTLYGDRAIYNITDTSSIYYDRKLIEFSLSLPDSIKLNEKLLINWLKEKHPTILQYKWSKCGTKPSSMFKINTGKLLKGINSRTRRLLKLNYDSMNPFDLWFMNNPAILKNLDNLFQQNIEVISNNALQKDFELVYSYRGDRFMRNKFTVITMLLALKMHIGVV